jgi:hypothetical protein
MLAGYTAFNQPGAFAIIQDANGEGLGRVQSRVRALHLRSLLMRSASAARFPEDCAKGCENQPFMRGMILVVGGKKSRPAYCVLEVDGNHSLDKGVTVRETSENAGRFGLVATNHFESRYRDEFQDERERRRSRGEGEGFNDRFGRSIKRSEDLAKACAGKELKDVESAFGALSRVSMTGTNGTTTHSYVIEPERGRVHLKICKDRQKGAQVETARVVELDTIFGK